MLEAAWANFMVPDSLSMIVIVDVCRGPRMTFGIGVPFGARGVPSVSSSVFTPSVAISLSSGTLNVLVVWPTAKATTAALSNLAVRATGSQIAWP